MLAASPNIFCESVLSTMSHRAKLNSASILFKTHGDLAEFTWYVRWGTATF